MNATEEIRSSLMNQGHSSKRIGEIMASLGGEANTKLTLAETKDVRSGIFRAKLAAARERRIDEAASLSRLYENLTELMRRRAADLGMSEDFETAESAWRLIERDEEVLDLLLSIPKGTVEGAKAFQEAWQRRTPEMRKSLKHLQECGALDLEKLEAEGKVVEDILKRLQRSATTDWLQGIARIFRRKITQRR